MLTSLIVSTYRAIPNRLWEKPLDFNLQATPEGELRVLFSHYVLPAEPTDSSGVTFPRFSDLPAELQLRVLCFCDNPTLFQLMHTSSCVRFEASKLFFSNPDSWYCVEAKWILRGCHPGDTRHDMMFFPLVTQLEVQFRRMGKNYWMYHYHCVGDPIQQYSPELEEEQDNAEELLEERFREFWRRLHTQFPRAARVILCESYVRTSSDLPLDIMKRVGRTCTPGIEISISLLKAKQRRAPRAERTTWRQVTDSEDTSVADRWKEMPSQPQPRITLPNKVFRGPIGAYEYLCYKYHQQYHHVNTTFVMLTAAVETHHFHGRHEPFPCPAPGCEASFHHPGDFTTHMIEQRQHREHIDPPAPFEAVFAQNNERAEVLSQGASNAFVALRELWGELGSERRDATARAARDQIAQDPLCAQGTPAEERRVFNLALKALDGGSRRDRIGRL